MKLEKNIEEIEQLYTKILQLLGEDVNREGLQKTPHRVAKSLLYLTEGGRNPQAEDILKSAIFTAENHEIILVKDIEFYSLCEHHILPFFGKVHIAYVPTKHITGLSKIPRMVDAVAHKLQLQERLTQEIAHALQSALAPSGVAVMIEANHMCMMMRGVQKQNAVMKTVCFLGDFQDLEKKKEFYTLIGN